MSEDKVTQNNNEEIAIEETPVAPAIDTSAMDASTAPTDSATPDAIVATPTNRSSAPNKDFKKNRRSSTRGRRERPRAEFDQKILDIRRVTRVSSGGRRFSFSVAMVIGDKKGRVGVGTGKAGDTALAIDKAVKIAKKNLILIPRTSTNSIAHDVQAKYCSGQVMMMPAPGRGLIAGSAVRDIFELSGLTDVNAKILSGTKNKLNIAQATIKALRLLNPAKTKAEKVSKK